jgi:hypothetical protein
MLKVMRNTDSLHFYCSTAYSIEDSIFLPRELGEANSHAEPELNAKLLAQIHSHQPFLIKLFMVTSMRDILKNKPEYCKI